MKDLREKASLYGYRKINAQKQIEIKDYMDERLAMWEPDLGKCLDLQVKKIE
jgi:hypothetical protein